MYTFGKDALTGFIRFKKTAETAGIDSSASANGERVEILSLTTRNYAHDAHLVR